MRWKVCNGCNIDGVCLVQKYGGGCNAVERAIKEDRTEIVIAKKGRKFCVTIGNQYTDGIKKICKNSQDIVDYIKSYLDCYNRSKK